MLFQVTAIILLLVFYGCYFGKMFLQKRQGIQTDQIGKGKTGTAKVIETLMKITTILVPLVEVICIVFNQTMLPFGARIKGAFIAAVGDIVFVTSVVTMKNSWRAGVSETDKTELITNGIYQISRNPAFLGFDLVYIGILLMFFQWGLLVLSVAAMVMFHLQIVKVEEFFLLQTFGKDYMDYKRKVLRYFGRNLRLIGEMNYEVFNMWKRNEKRIFVLQQGWSI